MTGAAPAIPAQAIAITGMAGRFPGAASIGEFWRNLAAGTESIRFFSTGELLAEGLDEETIGHPDYVPASGELAGSGMFDAAFFDYSAREAELMDPQHRLFLECAAQALERANVVPGPALRVAVLGGAGMSTYLLQNVLAHPDIIDAVGAHGVILSNDKDYIATRVAYKLGLTGPALTIQSSCSTSLVAVHLACRTLLTFEADVALVGGAAVGSPQRQGYVYLKGGIASPDGHCRAFDARAAGLPAGSGVGVVVLKRLEDALACRDVVHAVILGSAVNNDGAAKIGFTAPSISGQAAVITEALEVAQVTADTIGYVEAHGTATPLGDPVEVTALSRAFRHTTAERQYCALGSVKTNVGHLDAAAGVTGLIKAVLTVEHGQIPPSLNFAEPNPRIDFAASPFYVNTALRPWPANGLPRRAGVSSFGLGGTNVHVVLEQAAPREDPAPSPWPQLLLLSAKTDRALDTACANLATHLREHPEAGLADVAHTLRTGRRSYPRRRAVIAAAREEAIAALEQAGRLASGVVTTSAPPLFFLFPGIMTLPGGTGRQLYQRYRAFREQVDTCSEILGPHLGLDLRAVLRLAADAGPDDGAPLSPVASAGAIFTIEYALARLLLSWDITPRAMAGHSLGEYTAACLAGVFSLEDALRLVALRYQLLDLLPPGAMLSVPLPAAEVAGLLAPELSVAALNAPSSTVASGPVPAIDAFTAALAARGVDAMRLNVPVAMHSAMLDPVLAEFADAVGRVALKAPDRPFVSGVTGTWAEAEQVTEPGYWVRQFRDTVRFADAVATLHGAEGGIFLETGPGHALTSLARAQGHDGPVRAFSTLPHPQRSGAELTTLLEAVARLWLHGTPVTAAELHGDEQRCLVQIPTYSFDRENYWLTPGTGVAPVASSRPPREITAEDPADWFSLPSWRRSPPGPAAPDQKPAGTWLVFRGHGQPAAAVCDRLAQGGARMVEVRAGERFERDQAGYRIDPRRPSHYAELLAALRADGLSPDHVVHMWSLDDDAGPSPSVASFEGAQVPGFYSLLYLAQAAEAGRAASPLTIWLVTAGMHDVTGTEALRPAGATLLGPVRVLPQELSALTCRSIDVMLDGDDAAQAGAAARIVAEILANAGPPVVAYRGPHRWVPCLEQARLDPSPGPVLRDGGHYLITGGLDDYGAAFAGYLIARYAASVTVVEEETFPADGDWGAWLARHDERDPVSQRIVLARALHDRGVRPHLARADAASPESLRQALAGAVQRAGPLHGVLHTAGLRAEETRHLVPDATIAVCQEHFRARAHATIALAHALGDSPLDFCLVQTTLSPLLGGIGRVASAAASAFAQAFTQTMTRRNGAHWIAVSWDDGQYEGTATSRHAAIEAPFGPAEIGDITERILGARGHGHLAVSKSGLAERIDYWVHRVSSGEDAPTAASGRLHPRPALSGPYQPPRNQVEAQIASIWQTLLGIEPVGIEDDFFAMGGHSLLGTQLVARLRVCFDVDFPLRDLFEAPTVAGLAQRVVQIQAMDAGADDLEAILADLEQASQDGPESAGAQDGGDR